jgi:hypothetical protein
MRCFFSTSIVSSSIVSSSIVLGAHHLRTWGGDLADAPDCSLASVAVC